MARFKGPVVFGSDGVHYPATDDGPDLTRPLFFDADIDGYRDRKDTDPGHFDAYHVNHLELQFADESVIDVSESEAGAVRELLTDLRGE